MKKIILLVVLVAGGVALSATAFAQTASQTASLIPVLSLLLFGQEETDPPVDPPVVTETSLNDTGITGCAGNTKKEDCNYGRDVTITDPDPSDGYAGFSFTKLDSSGGVASGDWSCIQDNVTGLIWSLDKGSVNWSGIQAIVDTANDVDTPLCGKSGWRLPTVKELIGIVDYHKTSGAMIESTYFDNIQADWYWTSTVDADDSSNQWQVNFSTGVSEPLGTLQTDDNNVLLVFEKIDNA